MAITFFKIASGWDKLAGDVAAVPGLVSAQVRRIDYLYKPADQPAAIYPQRVIDLVYAPTGTPQDDTFDFYGMPQSQWTAYFKRRVKGADVELLYNVTLMECTLVVADSDVSTYHARFLLTAEALKAVQSLQPRIA